MNFLLRAFAKKYFHTEKFFVLRRIEEISKEIKASNYEDRESHLAAILVIAEDKRFYQHEGVDWIATFRAAYRTLIFKDIQGASTITQQLVRTITGDYRRSIRRKAKEILLALLINEEISKASQINCYLWIAYFGWRMNGIRQAAKKLDLSFPLLPTDASKLIARLKYPEPRLASKALSKRIEIREKILTHLYSEQRDEK